MSHGRGRNRWWVLLATAVVLAGCAQQGSNVAVEDGYMPVASGTVSAGHTVRQGDTLFSIARNYHIPVQRLVELNRLSQPYVIRVGQRLRLSSEPVRVGVMKPVRSQGGSARGRNDDRDLPVIGVDGPEQRALARVQGGVGGGSAAGWMWPSSGDVVSAISPSAGEKRGIDIIGKAGTPVYAAKAGTVVYAGNGLVGYGNLIIVKHDDKFLSAYAHSSRIDVREGQQVKVGQKIAEIGSSGTDRAKLHFQIRRDGQPVDPLQYLPRR